MFRAPLTLNIRYLNVQHYTQEKEPAILGHLTEGSPDIILITSTSRPREQPIRIQGYLTFTTNKSNELHAGSAIAIKKGIKFTIKNDFITDTIGAKVETQLGPVMVMTSYSPPRHRLLPTQDLEYMIRNQYPTILAGDLNARHSTFGYTSSHNAKGKELDRLILRDRLNYIGPNFNTFFTRNSATKPDCVITNNTFFLNYHITSGGLGPSDHLTVNIKISTNPIKVPCVPIRDIENVDWDRYTALLETVAELNLDGGTAVELENAFNNLYETINKAKDDTTPLKTFQTKHNIKTSSKFRRLNKILQRYSDMLQTIGKNEHLERAIRNTQLMLIQEGNQCKYEWWERQITKVEYAAKHNIKLWKHIKRLTGGRRAGIGNLRVAENGNIREAKTDLEKVNLLTEISTRIHQITPEDNRHFCGVNEARVEDTLNQNADQINPKNLINLNEIRDPNTQALPFDSLDITLAIKAVANKTPGPSKLKKPYISNLPPNIKKNITHLFNCCYAIGIYPDHFKQAEIIFIPKAGATHDPKNYRPISLLNFLGKVFATLLNKRLVEHLEENGILKESQHGFRKKKSSTTLIAQLYERIAREKAGGKNTLVTMVLRDVRKAFDTVWHRGLIYKLMQTGIETPLLRILANFLHNRRARIRINNTLGNVFNLLAGVPQGDVLSPTLYLVMCNDYPPPTINQQSRNFCKQYADDFTQVIVSKFNTNIKPQHREIHIRNVEAEINKLNEYEKLWKIKTNTDKFQIIHIGFWAAPDITINGTILRPTQEAKLLGMDFTYRNFFTKQVKSLKKNARGALSKLYRFRYLNKKLKLRLFKVMVLPLLTYPIIPLNALSNNKLYDLQVVQNDAIRWICNEHWPTRCPLQQRHADLKLEYLRDRIKRLSEGVWVKINEENSQFWRDTLAIPTHTPHNWFPSAYEASYL